MVRAREAGVGRHLLDREVGAGEEQERPFEPRAAHRRHRRPADRAREEPAEVLRRHGDRSGQLFERDRPRGIALEGAGDPVEGAGHGSRQRLVGVGRRRRREVAVEERLEEPGDTSRWRLPPPGAVAPLVEQPAEERSHGVSAKQPPRDGPAPVVGPVRGQLGDGEMEEGVTARALRVPAIGLVKAGAREQDRAGRSVERPAVEVVGDPSREDPDELEVAEDTRPERRSGRIRRRPAPQIAELESFGHVDHHSSPSGSESLRTIGE